MNIRKMAKIALLTTTICSAGFISKAAFAEATVTGTAGCVMSDSRAATETWNDHSGTGGSDFDYSWECNGNDSFPNGTGSNPWISGNFVTADEVNAALSQVYEDLGGDGYVYDPTKDNEQDARLDDHETRISTNEDDIAAIKDGAVYYDRDAQGNKTGGVTLDDGTGTPVRLSNVAEGTSGTDAVNVNQLNGAIDGVNQAVTNIDVRVTKNEGDIAAIQDGAVFYNRDANGEKTGGVSFDDGTGNAVLLSNVAAGKDGMDAVNVDQLNGVLAGLGGGATVNPDGSVTGPTYNIDGRTYTTVEAALQGEGKLSVQYVADEDGNPTNTVALVGDGTGAPVKISNVAAGEADSDAVNYGQVKDRVAYDLNEDGSRANSVTLTGGSEGPVAIHNLADGTERSDAATFGQLSDLRDYTDARFDALSGRVSNVQKEARGGIASAMATAALRFDDRPGKASVAAGMGGFKSASSMAAGVGYTSEDGRWRLNSALGYSFTSEDLSWNAGASWTFN